MSKKYSTVEHKNSSAEYKESSVELKTKVYLPSKSYYPVNTSLLKVGMKST